MYISLAEGSRSQSQSTMNDDLLKGDPEELFDVSEELLQSSPENILGSPDDFSDTFDLSPESLVSTALEPNYPPSTGVRPGNEAPTTCASNSNRSTSVSTMSDASGVEPSMLSPHNFNRQQSNSSTSPCKSDAGKFML